MKHWWFIILPIIVFVISCADLGATLYFAHTNIYFREANPIARYVWDTHGDVGLIIFKISVTFASCLCMGSVLKNKNRSWVISVSVFGSLGCLLLVGWWIFWFFYATVI